jgi:hypothetical protein
LSPIVQRVYNKTENVTIDDLITYGSLKTKLCMIIVALNMTRDNGTIKLVGRDELKKISSQALDILKMAANQKEYTIIVNTRKRNLEFTKHLPDNDYVVRTASLIAKGPIKYRTLLSKIRSIREEIGNPLLTATSIWESGIIHYAKDMMEKRNLVMLSTEHYKEISRWAGRSESLWFNTKRLITNFQII